MKYSSKKKIEYSFDRYAGGKLPQRKLLEQINKSGQKNLFYKPKIIKEEEEPALLAAK